MTRPTSPYGDSTPDAAAATPGPWEVSINPKWTPHDEWAISREITIRPVGEHPHGLWVADCGLSVDPEHMANARLIAAAPETAAERDRLVEGLVEIEASSSCYCARDVDGQRLGCKCPICVARATLSNARKPKSPEGVGG